MAARRVYLASTAPAAVSPAYRNTAVPEAFRRAIVRTRLAAELLSASVAGSIAAPGIAYVLGQFVSDYLAAGNVFTGSTVTCFLHALTDVGAPDEIYTAFRLFAVDGDGGFKQDLLQAPMSARIIAADYETADFAEADGVAGAYVSDVGDRLVAEVGFEATLLATPAEARFRIGCSGSADAPDFDGDPDITLNGWLEFSAGFTYLDELTAGEPILASHEPQLRRLASHA